MKPTVKQSEKSRILSTRDYSIFEFPDVKVSKKHLEAVMLSINEKNLLPDFPILVSEDYKILDGKYKFLAAYELKIPIYYKVSEVTTLEDAKRIKEIYRKTPFSELIQIYIDREPYAQILLLKNDAKTFSLSEIIRSLDEARQDCGLVCAINRLGFASGKLRHWDYDKARIRLSKMEFVIEEFEWDYLSALRLLIHSPKINFEAEAIYLRKAKSLADAERAFSRSRGDTGYQAKVSGSYCSKYWEISTPD